MHCESLDMECPGRGHEEGYLYELWLCGYSGVRVNFRMTLVAKNYPKGSPTTSNETSTVAASLKISSLSVSTISRSARINSLS